MAASLVFRNAYISWGFLPAVTAAVVLSVGISAVAFRLGLPFGSAALVSLAAYFPLGATVLFGVPTPAGLEQLFVETIRGWRGLLTTAAPADPAGALRIVPFIVAWVGSFVAAESVLRTRSLALPVVGPLFIFVAAALFGLDTNTLASVLGLVLLLGLIVFIWLRSDESWLWHQGVSPLQTSRRAVASAVTIVVAAAISIFVAPLVPVAGSQDRTNLREVVDPPFEIRDLRTPLVSFKESLRDDAEDDVVLTVSGPDLAGRELRLATLGRYDGVIWTAADSDSADGLVPVGTRFPDLVAGGTGQPERFEFVLQSLGGNWLPSVGAPQALEWGPRAEELLGGEPQLHLRVDPDGGNLLINRGLGPSFNRVGLTYTVEASALGSVDDVEADTPVSFAPRVSEELSSPFRDLARDIVGQSGAPLQKVRAIELALSDFDPDRADSVSPTGAGKNPTYDLESPPGHALHRVIDLLYGDTDEYRGTAEQYAAAFALLLAAVDVPSRIVVGYVVDGELVESFGEGLEAAEVRRSDLAVWIEVPFEGVGWVGFPAGPMETAQPEGQPSAGGGSRSLSTVPPTPSQDEPVEELDENRSDDVEGCTDDDCEEQAGRSFPTIVVYALITIGLIVATLALFAATVRLLKGRRRRRRRRSVPAASIAGAWREMLDLKVDEGKSIREMATIRETVIDLTDTAGQDDVQQLSHLAESSAFSGSEPTESDADRAWGHLHGIEQAQSHAETRVATARRQLSLRSLRGGEEHDCRTENVGG
ncbi:MAG: transglutaminase domain-containing protein [Actinomycetia bacterium]|nr:transglutaminase domain-containing protein [Actinomycetes bacterium]